MNHYNNRMIPMPPSSRQGIVDTNMYGVFQMLPPVALIEKFPTTESTDKLVVETRKDVSNIMHGRDDRLIVISGPCSIHDPKAALDYCHRLMDLKEQYKNELLIIMRVYFEKPRTTVGWKGLINDPDLDNSFDINNGMRIARELLLKVNAMGMPVATEFLDPITPQYIDEFISWGAIGARTTESQVHRQLASGMSCPIGFKNATDGSVKIAVDAMVAARHEHTFLSVTKMGHVAICHTRGNNDTHIILRGGSRPNYSKADVDAACAELINADQEPKVMIDFSHANSLKQYKKQLDVAEDIALRIGDGDDRIFGVMIESNLVEGRQDLGENLDDLVYGQSITDACISFDDTTMVIKKLAQAVQKRRMIKK